MHAIDPMFLINLLLCGVFFAAGTALGFVASRCRPQAVQAVMLVVAGLLVGEFLYGTILELSPCNSARRLQTRES